MFEKDMIDEDLLEIYGTRIKINDITYSKSPESIEKEKLEKLNPRPYKLMNTEIISFNCEEIETGKDNGQIEITKYLPNDLIQNKEVTNKIIEEFNKYEISEDYEPQQLLKNPDYLVSIIRNIDWSKEEKENQINIEF